MTLVCFTHSAFFYASTDRYGPHLDTSILIITKRTFLLQLVSATPFIGSRRKTLRRTARAPSMRLFISSGNAKPPATLLSFGSLKIFPYIGKIHGRRPPNAA